MSLITRLFASELALVGRRKGTPETTQDLFPKSEAGIYRSLIKLLNNGLRLLHRSTRLTLRAATASATGPVDALNALVQDGEDLWAEAQYGQPFDGLEGLCQRAEDWVSRVEDSINDVIVFIWLCQGLEYLWCKQMPRAPRLGAVKPYWNTGQAETYGSAPDLTPVLCDVLAEVPVQSRRGLGRKGPWHFLLVGEVARHMDETGVRKALQEAQQLREREPAGLERGVVPSVFADSYALEAEMLAEQEQVLLFPLDLDGWVGVEPKFAAKMRYHLGRLHR